MSEEVVEVAPPEQQVRKKRRSKRKSIGVSKSSLKKLSIEAGVDRLSSKMDVPSTIATEFLLYLIRKCLDDAARATTIAGKKTINSQILFATCPYINTTPVHFISEKGNSSTKGHSFKIARTIFMRTAHRAVQFNRMSENAKIALQHYCEETLVKVLRCANMIAKNSNRKTLKAKDLALIIEFYDILV